MIMKNKKQVQIIFNIPPPHFKLCLLRSAFCLQGVKRRNALSLENLLFKIFIAVIKWVGTKKEPDEKTNT